MVTANGFPKSGNHALVKALQLMGQPCEVNHTPFGEQLINHVFIKRDPRNIVCSWLRFVGQPVTAGTFLAAFRRFQTDSLCQEMGRYVGWLTDSKTLIVKYEDLIATDAEMRRIANFLSIPYIEDAFKYLPGLTRTWYADHSDYRTIWSNDVASTWQNEGGNELLTQWGY